MASTSTTSNSHFITIKAGDSYVLKKTAKILSIASFGGATINAPCFDTSVVESFSCYVIKGFTARPNHSSATVNGEGQQAMGIYIGATFYPFTTTYAIDDGENNNLINEIKATDPFKSVMRNICYVEDVDESRGTTFYYTFLSVPSVASTMRMFIQASDIHTHGKIDMYYPVLSFAYLTATDGDTSTTCGCGASSGGGG